MPVGAPPKGGARFPRQPLADALPWARKLVSKTHLAPQAKDVVLSGVVATRGPRGEIKISTLKQYGLMEGTSAAYTATDLAKNICRAPDNELKPLYQSSVLNAKVFNLLFETFHGDEVTRAKLKQRVSELNVHPDELDNCVDIYIASMQLAGLGISDGDRFSHISMEDRGKIVSASENNAAAQSSDAPVELKDDHAPTSDDHKKEDVIDKRRIRQNGSVFNINVNLDASLDTDKLERQLQLLKRYGAL